MIEEVMMVVGLNKIQDRRSMAMKVMVVGLNKKGEAWQW